MFREAVAGQPVYAKLLLKVRNARLNKLCFTFVHACPPQKRSDAVTSLTEIHYLQHTPISFPTAPARPRHLC